MAQSRYWKCMSPRVPVPIKGRLTFLSREIELTSDTLRCHRVNVPIGRFVLLEASYVTS